MSCFSDVTLEVAEDLLYLFSILIGIFDIPRKAQNLCLKTISDVQSRTAYLSCNKGMEGIEVQSWSIGRLLLIAAYSAKLSAS